jgi:hypothetical protein
LLVSDDLTALWIRADQEDPAFTGDEVRRLSAMPRRLLESYSLLRISASLTVMRAAMVTWRRWRS